jgi:hypothetical protein
MNINYNIFLSLVLGIIFYLGGIVIGKKIKNKNLKYFLLFFSFILSVPGLSMILYYLQFFKLSVWYVDFRTINFIEGSNSFIGLFFGLLNPQGLRKYIYLAVLILFLIVPYIKPVLRPLNIDKERGWKDNVCLQSTGATCGPSCLATIFRHYNLNKSESEIAKASYSCSTGTEIWYLLRYAKSQGLKYQCSIHENIKSIKPPAIVGVNLGSIGHFITYLEKKDSIYIIGDPLDGQSKLTEAYFNKRYKKLDGFVVEFNE